MILDNKYYLINNKTNITYEDNYLFNYFFDTSLLFVLLIFIFASKQIYQYYNCNGNNENNENNLEERILSSTGDIEDSNISNNNIETENDVRLPSYSEITI